jgi:hypothetical protein
MQAKGEDNVTEEREEELIGLFEVEKPSEVASHSDIEFTPSDNKENSQNKDNEGPIHIEDKTPLSKPSRNESLGNYAVSQSANTGYQNNLMMG